MGLLQAVSSHCCFSALSVVAPGRRIAIPGKGTDADEHSAGGSGTVASVRGDQASEGGEHCLPGILAASQSGWASRLIGFRKFQPVWRSS
ncbi:hypothetical protein WME79_31070 [Sorangium sp. So ce726]|uniref:hypothetical protein n=1 Tax=Sorangium sp. So ce726 TaxID=3133319 RepID=UPI003F5E82F4